MAQVHQGSVRTQVGGGACELEATRSDPHRLCSRLWREPEDGRAPPPARRRWKQLGHRVTQDSAQPRVRAAEQSRRAERGKLGLAIFTRTLFQPQRPFAEASSFYLVEVSLR